MTDALSAWSNYISGVGTLKIQLNIAALGAPTASGFFTVAEGGPTQLTYLGQSGGRYLYQGSAATALTTGSHAAASDVTIIFNAQLLAAITTEASLNLVAVFEHELMHGLGMTGLRSTSGVLGSSQTTFDALSALSGGSDSFVGGAAESVYGGPVPLTTGLAGSNYYHLGATGTSADPAVLYNDIMDPVSGAGRSISGLDVAILRDLGLSLTPAGYALYAPAPFLTASSRSVGGAPVTTPQISGKTQAGDQVTLTENGQVVGQTNADGSGAWSINPTGLADGVHVFVASVASASQPVIYGVGIVLDATTPVQTIYAQVLGRAADASGLAGYRYQLITGTSVAAVRAVVAQGVESETDIGRLYAAILGRWVEQAGLVNVVAGLSNGATQAGLRVTLAQSVESETDIGKIFAAALGRWVDQASLEGLVANLANGGTQSNIRSVVAQSGESAGAIGALYAGVLGRAASAADVTGWQGFFAAGSSLAVLRTTLAASQEATTAITAIYSALLGRSAAGVDITGWQSFFAAGSSLAALRTATATSSESAAQINSFAQSALGHALDAATLASDQQAESNGATLAAIKLGIATSADATSQIVAAYASTVAAPNAVEIAADQSALASGIPLSVVQAQIGALAGGAPSPANSVGFVAITPVTIGSTTPSTIYGLLHNNALQAAAPESVSATYSGASGITMLNAFNPATDILQIRSQEAGSYAAIQKDMVYSGGSTFIPLSGGATIDLIGVTPTQLSAANFHIV